MIPQHLIDKAAQAIVAGMGSSSRLVDMHPEDAAYARADARAALEAVAADIWEEGCAAGIDWEAAWTAFNEFGGDEPDDITNPYLPSEDA